MKTITREWIMANRTDRGAWTRAQIEALGIQYPPSSGWIARLTGTAISDEKSQAFVEGRLITAKIAKVNGTPELPLHTQTNHSPTISERLDCIEMHVAAIRNELREKNLQKSFLTQPPPPEAPYYFTSKLDVPDSTKYYSSITEMLADGDDSPPWNE